MMRAFAETKQFKQIKVPLLTLKPVKKANLPSFTVHHMQFVDGNVESLRNPHPKMHVYFYFSEPPIRSLLFLNLSILCVLFS